MCITFKPFVVTTFVQLLSWLQASCRPDRISADPWARRELPRTPACSTTPKQSLARSMKALARCQQRKSMPHGLPASVPSLRPKHKLDEHLAL